MQLVDLSKPGEKKKLLFAAGLGFGAIVVLWWALFGFGSSTPPNRAQSERDAHAAQAPEIRLVRSGACARQCRISLTSPRLFVELVL